MLRVLANALAKSRPSPLIRISRATYIRGYWPEPITQQTLAKFLADINYFEKPSKFNNIGIKPDKKIKTPSVPAKSFADQVDETSELKLDDIDSILELLAEDVPAPPLDFDDVRLQGDQLVNLAISSGIFRDLFGSYNPDREYISFTQEQGERMDCLVPPYWITDQPFARVKRRFEVLEPLTYFDPIINISARFVNHEPNESGEDSVYSHASYYGNILPASEVLVKPSITLDGKLLNQDQSDDFIKESNFSNWSPGLVETVNFDKKDSKKYSVILVNLDHLNDGAATLHWMLSNIDPHSSGDSIRYEETCKYLPVHGIRGFGYSRYVFIVLQHDGKLNSEVQGSSLESRKFDMNEFLGKHKAINMTPVGLSWFQTQWDESSNEIFHDHLNMRAPVYEHVQAEPERPPVANYPGKRPFNIFLDHERDKKKTNEMVLLERLKEVDPFDYKDQYVPPKVPPTVFKDDEGLPSWMSSVMFKKKNKVGVWRGLRPASATLPLNNNADLDQPLRPIASSKKSPPDYHNQYFRTLKPRKIKDNPLDKPANEHTPVFIEPDHEIHMEAVKKVLDRPESKSEPSKK